MKLVLRLEAVQACTALVSSELVMASDGEQTLRMCSHFAS